MIGWLIQLLIRLYWVAVPKSRRRRCLFAESCSHHVYRLVRDEGARVGIRALRMRWKQCRPGYRVNWSATDGELCLVLVDQTVLPRGSVAPSVLAPLCAALSARALALQAQDGARHSTADEASRAARQPICGPSGRTSP